MTERVVVVRNRSGLHARPAAKLVHLTSSLAAEIELVKDGEVVDAKSILGVLLLAAPQGTTLTIRCSGENEEEAAEQVAALFEHGFGEDQT